MVSRRESLHEALRLWRIAERELVASGDGRDDLEANVARLRDEYQRLYTEGMVENIERLHEADERRSRATPSTFDFHAATRDTEEIAADIWEQARRGDRDTPPTRFKAQQDELLDELLADVEDGTVTLIGAATENP
jgi:phosphate uptake regulator